MNLFNFLFNFYIFMFLNIDILILIIVKNNKYFNPFFGSESVLSLFKRGFLDLAYFIYLNFI